MNSNINWRFFLLELPILCNCCNVLHTSYVSNWINIYLPTFRMKIQKKFFLQRKFKEGPKQRIFWQFVKKNNTYFRLEWWISLYLFRCIDWKFGLRSHHFLRFPRIIEIVCQLKSFLRFSIFELHLFHYKITLYPAMH